jgi:transposase-like protein
MEFTKVQLRALIGNHLRRENGLNDVMEWILNALMRHERSEHLLGEPTSNKANGFRPGRTYGQGKILELRIPRDRNGQFYPRILALLRDQQGEIDRLVSSLYAQGLTQDQLGTVFEELYGHHYSPSSIGRMLGWMRQDVNKWLNRPLAARYPIVFIDAISVKVRRPTVAQEAFYVVLAVTPDRRREVLDIFHMPTESATGWGILMDRLAERGLRQVDLFVADGIAGLGPELARRFPAARVQRCVVHIKRQLLARVRPADKAALAGDLAGVFRVDDPHDNCEQGWDRWQAMCRRWADRYAYFGRLADNPDYIHAFTYLSYDPRMRSMIYTTNWIERLNRDFRRVLRMRASMPGEHSVITLIGKVAMDKKAFRRIVPKLDYDQTLFGTDPDEFDTGWNQ